MSFNKEWEAVHSSMDWGMTMDDALSKRISIYFPEPKGLTLLDLGCGIGANAIPLSLMGYTVTAVDGSSTAIEKLKKNARGHCIEVEAVCDDITSPSFYKFRSSRFDVIIDICTLEMLTLTDAEFVVGHCRELLKPGGLFFSKMSATTVPHGLDRTGDHRAATLHQVTGMFKDYFFDKPKIAVSILPSGWVRAHWLVEAKR